MEPPIEFYQKLREIDSWARGKVPLPPLTGNDDFMEVALDLMNHTRFILGSECRLRLTRDERIEGTQEIERLSLVISSGS